MYKIISSITLFALSGACTGTSTGNPVGEEPELTLGSYTAQSFRVESTGSPSCESDTEDGADKFEPTLSEIEDIVGEDATEFIVLMTTEITQDDYPFTDGDRGTPLEENAEYLARAEAIANTQLCAIDETERLGGTYVESFVIINAFVAELTVEQAEELAERADVRSLELSETMTPPPL